MVKLPDESDLGVRNPRAARGQPDYPSSSPVAAALQNLGGTIAQVGFSAAQQDRVKADKTQALGVESRMLQFEDQWMKSAVERVNTAQPGAAGFSESLKKDYATSAQEFFRTVPDELKPVYDQKLFEVESRLTQRASTFEREESDRYSKTQVADGQNVLLNRQAADPNAWQTVERDGEALIRARPGASPIEADEEVRAWRQRRAQQLFETRRAQGEAPAREGLGVGTGAAALLRKFEGFRSDTYWDVNAHRLGYGSDTITKADGSVVSVKQGDTVTREDAERDLARRASEFERTAARQVGPDRWSQLPGNARAALTSVTYNYGSLPSSVVSAVRSGDAEQIAAAVEGLKGHNGGINAKRRAEEAAIIRGQDVSGVDYSILSNPAPEYAALPFEDRMKMFEQSLADEKRKQNESNAQTRFDIGIAETNAPAAFQQTGAYTGPMPSMEQYITAYGEQEGVQRYEQFTGEVETGQQVFNMQSAPAAEIAATVEAARPVSGGMDAAQEQKRYGVLSTAAKTVLDAREADPAGYVTRTFPAVSQAFEEAQSSGDYAPAIRMSVEAQTSLGIQNVRPLPKPVASAAVETFKDANMPETDRLAVASQMFLATQDPTQRKAIFEQMVAEGLPDTTDGAFVALDRGDTGAARRLFQAAMTDISKLPGQAPFKPSEIDEAIERLIMADEQIGDIYYGMADGAIENTERAQRDSKLIGNAVNIRVRNGETLDAAVSAVAKDLYGDVKTVLGDGRAGAQILVPKDTDEEAVMEGLAGLMPAIETRLREVLTVPPDAPAADGSKAIMNAAGQNEVGALMSEGYFRNIANGYMFFLPRLGAVADDNGEPLIFTMDDILAAGVKKPRDVRAPEAPLTDDAFDAFQNRMQQ